MITSDLKPKELKALLFIRDNILYKGVSPSLRAIQKELEYNSSRSASLIIDNLTNKGYIQRTMSKRLRLLKNIDGSINANRTIDIPLVGAVPCGIPLLAEENMEALIPVSQSIARPGAQYFILRAVGDSMNQAGIQDGDLVLVRQQPVAENGDRVVALINDKATIKEFQRTQDTVILRPRSDNSIHKPIILDEEFLIQGVVIAVIPNDA